MKRTFFGDAVWLLVLMIISMFFALPASNQIYIDLNDAYPYLMGFFKFAILASMGEWLVTRLKNGSWKMPVGFGYKMLVWGLLGIAITFMFSFYSAGVAALAEKLSPGNPNEWWGNLLRAFATSALMNLTFGPVFMALHRISDTTIEFLVQKRSIGKGVVISAIDWVGFINFVVLKTIPLWWIPVHTLTFLLPVEYRVMAAAYLSIALGILLVLAKNRKAPIAVKKDTR